MDSLFLFLDFTASAKFLATGHTSLITNSSRSWRSWIIFPRSEI